MSRGAQRSRSRACLCGMFTVSFSLLDHYAHPGRHMFKEPVRVLMGFNGVNAVLHERFEECG